MLCRQTVKAFCFTTAFQRSYHVSNKFRTDRIDIIDQNGAIISTVYTRSLTVWPGQHVSNVKQESLYNVKVSARQQCVYMKPLAKKIYGKSLINIYSLAIANHSATNVNAL